MFNNLLILSFIIILIITDLIGINEHKTNYWYIWYFIGSGVHSFCMGGGGVQTSSISHHGFDLWHHIIVRKY